MVFRNGARVGHGAFATSLSLALALMLGQASGAKAAEDFSGQSLVLQSWGGAIKDAEEAAFYAPFQNTTGAKIRVVEATSAAPAQLKAQVTSGNVEWDMITGWGEATMRRLAREGLLEKIDFDKVPGLQDLIPGSYFEYGVATEVDAVIAAYSTADGVKPLSSMKDYFDVENFPGPRAAPNWGTAEISCIVAMLADGVPREDLFPIDIDRCLKIWDRVKPFIEVWYQSGQQLATALINDSVQYCLCWDGRLHQARRINPNWTLTFDGGEIHYSMMGIVKGTKHSDMAHALIQLATDPQRQAVFVQSIGYSAPNPAVEQFLPDSFKQYLSTSPENRAKLFAATSEEWKIIADSTDSINMRWTEWVSR